jgi:hypothetical protein
MVIVDLYFWAQAANTHFVHSLMSHCSLFPITTPVFTLRNLSYYLPSIKFLFDLMLYVRAVILGGISIYFPTYFMVSTGKCLSRKCLQNDGAFEHRHAQASVEAGRYLITR